MGLISYHPQEGTILLTYHSAQLTCQTTSADLLNSHSFTREKTRVAGTWSLSGTPEKLLIGPGKRPWWIWVGVKDEESQRDIREVKTGRRQTEGRRKAGVARERRQEGWWRHIHVHDGLCDENSPPPQAMPGFTHFYIHSTQHTDRDGGVL